MDTLVPFLPATSSSLSGTIEGLFELTWHLSMPSTHVACGITDKQPHCQVWQTRHRGLTVPSRTTDAIVHLIDMHLFLLL